MYEGESLLCRCRRQSPPAVRLVFCRSHSQVALEPFAGRFHMHHDHVFSSPLILFTCTCEIACNTPAANEIAAIVPKYFDDDPTQPDEHGTCFVCDIVINPKWRPLSPLMPNLMTDPWHAHSDAQSIPFFFPYYNQMTAMLIVNNLPS